MSTDGHTSSSRIPCSEEGILDLFNEFKDSEFLAQNLEMIADNKTVSSADIYYMKESAQQLRGLHLHMVSFGMAYLGMLERHGMDMKSGKVQ